jgi:SAM-dependent methyltransferase
VFAVDIASEFEEKVRENCSEVKFIHADIFEFEMER